MTISRENSKLPIVFDGVDGWLSPKRSGTMMAEADNAVFAPLTEHQNVWRSEDRRFLKITITTQGQRRPQTVRMTHESICSAKTDSNDLKDDMLHQVPESSVVTTQH